MYQYRTLTPEEKKALVKERLSKHGAGKSRPLGRSF
jgi:hypothetical protein